MNEIIYSYNNNNTTYCKIKVGQHTYTIEGYSRAGYMTSIGIKELNTLFDMGCSKLYYYDNKLISHGHMDHIGALHTDHSSRRFFNIMNEKLYIMPTQCIIPFKVIAGAFSEMNSGKSLKNNINLLNTHIIESESCNEYIKLIGTSYYVKAFEMDHKIKSFGYIIYLKSKKLKKEYIGMDGNMIKKIRMEIGVENLTDECYSPLVGYTGDTSIKGLLINREFLDVPLLIMECTGFSDEDITTTREGKHIHWNDIIENKEKFNNMKIILFHFSQKYKTYEDLMKYTGIMDSSFFDKLLFFL
jgi:ribonuclease Z